jgi:hypothetical protein
VIGFVRVPGMGFEHKRAQERQEGAPGGAPRGDRCEGRYRDRVALGAESPPVAHAEGQAMTLEEAAAYALEEE